MAEAWFILQLSDRCDVALEQGAVRRILHRADPDFEAGSAAAADVRKVLGLAQDAEAPAVVVLLESGAVWAVSGVSLLDRRGSIAYLPLPPDLFVPGETPWCRGLLAGKEARAFVADAKALEALGA